LIAKVIEAKVFIITAMAPARSIKISFKMVKSEEDDCGMPQGMA
jgi:hypothetical protein